MRRSIFILLTSLSGSTHPESYIEVIIHSLHDFIKEFHLTIENLYYDLNKLVISDKLNAFIFYSTMNNCCSDIGLCVTYSILQITALANHYSKYI